MNSKVEFTSATGSVAGADHSTLTFSALVNLISPTAPILRAFGIFQLTFPKENSCHEPTSTHPFTVKVIHSGVPGCPSFGADAGLNVEPRLRK